MFGLMRLAVSAERLFPILVRPRRLAAWLCSLPGCNASLRWKLRGFKLRRAESGLSGTTVAFRLTRSREDESRRPASVAANRRRARRRDVPARGARRASFPLSPGEVQPFGPPRIPPSQQLRPRRSPSAPHPPLGLVTREPTRRDAKKHLSRTPRDAQNRSALPVLIGPPTGPARLFLFLADDASTLTVGELPALVEQAASAASAPP